MGPGGMRVERVLGRRLASWRNKPNSFWAQVTHQMLPATLARKTPTPRLNARGAPRERAFSQPRLANLQVQRRGPGWRAAGSQLGRLDSPDEGTQIMGEAGARASGRAHPPACVRPFGCPARDALVRSAERQTTCKAG